MSCIINRSELRDFGTSDARINGGTWAIARIGSVHRDSDALDVANHESLIARLEAVDPDGAHHEVMHCGHWAVGWIDHVIVDVSHAGVMGVLATAMGDLEDYPILDEMHYSEVEQGMHEDGECREHCSECEYERERVRDYAKTQPWWQIHARVEWWDRGQYRARSHDGKLFGPVLVIGDDGEISEESEE